MKSIISITILVFTFTSCKNQKLDLKPDIQHIDTLYLGEKFWQESDGTSNSIFKLKPQTEEGLPKNDTIFLHIETKGEFKNIMRFCDMSIHPISDSVVIRKIDNVDYKIFIKPEFNQPILNMNVFLHPKKNVALKAYFYDGILMFPDSVKIFMKANYIKLDKYRSINHET